MKIALFTAEFPPYPGGVARYSWELAAAAAACGHEVSVFSFSDQRVEEKPPSGVSIASIARHAAPYRIPWLALLARRALRRSTFDLIIAADYRSIAAVAWIPSPALKVGVIHGTETRSTVFRLTDMLRFYRPLEWVDLIIANSEFTKRLCLVEQPYLDPARVRAVPLGVDQSWFDKITDDAQRPSAARAIADDVFLIISVGRIERRKGLHVSIAALDLIPEPLRHRVVYMVVGGVAEPAYAAELRRPAEAAKVPVRFLGKVDEKELRYLYQRADLMLHTCVSETGRVEGFGLVLLEAAAAGLPVVASAIDAVPEVVVDGETGLLVPERSPAEVANAIGRIAADEAFRAKLSAAARVHARTFTWSRHLQGLFAAVNEHSTA